MTTDFSKLLPELISLKFSKIEPYQSKHGKMRRLEAFHPMFKGMHGLGIDPGRNFGVAAIRDGELQLWWGTMDKQENLYEYGADAYVLARGYIYNQHKGATPAIVEGAAYHATYGQTGLAEVRFGFYLGLRHAGLAAEIVPPASIRKRAFGSAKVMGWELWPTLNSNAADAAGCAICSALSTSGKGLK